MNKPTLATLILAASALLAPNVAADDTDAGVPEVCQFLSLEECAELMDVIAELVSSQTTYYITLGNSGTARYRCLYDSGTNTNTSVWSDSNYVEVGEEVNGQKTAIHRQYYVAFRVEYLNVGPC